MTRDAGYYERDDVVDDKQAIPEVLRSLPWQPVEHETEFNAFVCYLFAFVEDGKCEIVAGCPDLLAAGVVIKTPGGTLTLDPWDATWFVSLAPTTRRTVDAPTGS